MKVMDPNSPCNDCRYYEVNCHFKCLRLHQYLKELDQKQQNERIKENEQ
jgi:hypothetical protein